MNIWMNIALELKHVAMGKIAVIMNVDGTGVMDKIGVREVEIDYKENGHGNTMILCMLQSIRNSMIMIPGTSWVLPIFRERLVSFTALR